MSEAKVFFMLCVLAFVTVAGVVYYFEKHPNDDAENYTECVASHTEQHVALTSGGAGYGGVPIGSNMELVTTNVCDRDRTFTCTRWQLRETWLGGVYRACTQYD